MYISDRASNLYAVLWARCRFVHTRCYVSYNAISSFIFFGLLSGWRAANQSRKGKQSQIFPMSANIPQPLLDNIDPFLTQPLPRVDEPMFSIRKNCIEHVQCFQTSRASLKHTDRLLVKGKFAAVGNSPTISRPICEWHCAIVLRRGERPCLETNAQCHSRISNTSNVDYSVIALFFHVNKFCERPAHVVVLIDVLLSNIESIARIVVTVCFNCNITAFILIQELP